MAKFRVQVLVDKGTENEKWTFVRARLDKTYDCDSREEAEKAAKMYYGEDPERVRVVEYGL